MFQIVLKAELKKTIAILKIWKTFKSLFPKGNYQRFYKGSNQSCMGGEIKLFPLAIFVTSLRTCKRFLLFLYTNFYSIFWESEEKPDRNKTSVIAVHETLFKCSFFSSSLWLILICQSHLNNLQLHWYAKSQNVFFRLICSMACLTLWTD